MTAEELLQATRELIKRWDNVRVVGQGWSGDTRRGFQFNPIRTSTSVTSSPPANTGACCPAVGSCFVTSQAICEAGGGIYQGDGTTCDPDPCSCCDRNVTEINFFTLFGSFTGTTTSGCNDIASETLTWTRINHADSFDGSDQFKLWIDAGCGINLQFSGSHLFGGFPHLSWSTGVFSNAVVTFFSLVFNATPSFSFQYIASASTCIVGSCDSTLTQSPISISLCDFSPIIGAYATSNSCVAGDGSWHTDVSATFTIS